MISEPTIPPYGIQVLPLPNMLGYRIRLFLDARDVEMPDGELVWMEARAFEWERINIAGARVVAWIDVDSMRCDAGILFGLPKSLGPAEQHKHIIVLVDEPVTP